MKAYWVAAFELDEVGKRIGITLEASLRLAENEKAARENFIRNNAGALAERFEVVAVPFGS